MSSKSEASQTSEPVIETAQPVRRKRQRKPKNEKMIRNPKGNKWMIFYEHWQRSNPELMLTFKTLGERSKAASVIYRELPTEEKELLEKMAAERKSFSDPPYDQIAGKTA